MRRSFSKHKPDSLLKGPTDAAGFTLIEVLVALLILSVGLLGLAGLQLTGLRGNHGASLRTQATMRAYDIVDRMRVNRTAVAAGAYDIALGAGPPNPVVTIAQQDLRDWLNALATLPGPGDGSVVVNGDSVNVVVRWDDSRSGANNAVITIDSQL